MDPFHVVQLATEALDEIRREIWPEALISLAMLKLGGLCPPLPGRVTAP